MYVAADFTWGLPETAALGRATRTQEPSHPTMPHLTPPIRPPESPMPGMVSPSSINANSGMNACYGSAAVLLPQRPPVMTYASSSSAWQQRPMPHKITQPPISGDYFVGAKGTGAPMTLGASGDSIGDSPTVTMHWLRADSIWAQAQVLVTYQIHNSYVHPLMESFRLETYRLQNGIAVANEFTTGH